MIERFVPGRPIEAPKTIGEMRSMIDGLKSLHEKGGYGPEKLQKMKDAIISMQLKDEERVALMEYFDNKLAELLVSELEELPDKERRKKWGMNKSDEMQHRGLIGMYLKYDIPKLPLFSEERRHAIVTRVEQMLWRKGLVTKENITKEE